MTHNASMSGAAEPRTVDAVLACPHCGHPAMLEESHPTLPNGTKDTLFRVRCTLRECQASTLDWYPAEAAVAAWNRRVNVQTPNDLLSARLDRLWQTYEMAQGRIREERKRWERWCRSHGRDAIELASAHDRACRQIDRYNKLLSWIIQERRRISNEGQIKENFRRIEEILSRMGKRMEE